MVWIVSCWSNRLVALVVFTSTAEGWQYNTTVLQHGKSEATLPPIQMCLSNYNNNNNNITRMVSLSFCESS